jgi:protein arginine kinase
MTDRDDLPDDGLPWLDASGPENAMVVSTRVRLARNLAAVPFWGHNSAEDRENVVRTVSEAARTMPSLDGSRMVRVDGASLTVRRWLSERQLVSRDLAGAATGARVRTGAALVLGRSVSAMVNEEDHLRVQAFRSGFALGPAYGLAHQAERELGVRISFAFHPEFGYLTACPTNVGTGLRASVLIHLPALVLTKEIAKVLQSLTQVGLTSRGLFGEGSEALGHLFQLSNQTTLGRTEAELLEHLERMVRQVMAYEERAREVLQRDARLSVEDRAWRAWAVLSHARALSFEELVNLLSSVRLGVAWRVLPDVSLHTLNQLLVVAQAAHVARSAGVSLEAETIPEHRALLVRRMFEEQNRS